MAQEYIALKKATDLGMIAINTSVFETIAQIAVEEEENVAMAEGTPFKSPLNCKVSEDKLVITLEIKVNYSMKVNEVCARLQNKIFESIQHMCEYAPDVIDIKVSGFIF